ncbi:MAG TPA: M23 family metallopeptidase [Thermoanaerobaculia bacterium]
MKRLLIPTLLLLSLPLAALEIRVQPGEVVYAYEVDPARGLYTVLLQNVAVVQKDGGPVTLDSLEIQAVNGGQAVQTVIVPAADLEKSAQRLSAMEAQGLLKLYDFHFQTSRYLNGLKIAPNRTLSPGSALVVFGKPLLLAGLPSDGLAIVARGKDAEGRPAEARTTLKVENHRSPNEYVFPLAGTWYIGAGPNFESPHRWAANEEFAFDLAALGGDGLTHKGDGSHLADYYAYGRGVLAVADGEVVEVGADATEANDRLQQPGESQADFEKRTYLEQAKLIAQSYKAPLGNYVILRHAGGEFSHYAHLKQGSVRVKAGDAVKRGQPIAQLGQTGNTTEPHLHFQLTDGPDPLYSRGVPILFKNAVNIVGFSGSYLQTGWIVTAR